MMTKLGALSNQSKGPSVSLNQVASDLPTKEDGAAKPSIIAGETTDPADKVIEICSEAKGNMIFFNSFSPQIMVFVLFQITDVHVPHLILFQHH